MKNLKSLAYTFLLAAVITSCSSNPYSRTNRIYDKQAKVYAKELRTFPVVRTTETKGLNYAEHQAGTTNFNLRKPNYVIIHHTAQESVQKTLNTFTLPRTQVSAHYVIGKDGEIYQMLNDYYRAWHAGAGKWGNNTDLNSTSLGIELDNNGDESFNPLQIASLLQLLEVLKEIYNIPAANFIGHSDIAPTRKIDPNPTFPWKLLAEKGFGLWYDEEVETSRMVIDARAHGDLKIKDSVSIATNTPAAIETTPAYLDVDPELALRIIGYDTSNLNAAIKAFKLHFIQSEVNEILTDQDLKILNNLYRKYL